MLLLDLTHTSHTPANTGIQRQARGVFHALSRLTTTAPICLDPFANAWRPLDAVELRYALGNGTVGRSRGAQWTLSQKLRGWGGRLTGRTPALPAASALVCPEIFSPTVARNLVPLFNHCTGPRVAFYFDSIPLTHPEFTPAKTVARFPFYLQELLQFDGIAANSQTTAEILLGYWGWLGVRDCPPVTVVPLGVDVPGAPPPPAPASALPQILCVSSIEGRKNHLALLGAAETLWAAGLHFELRLVGMPRPETASAALAEIARLRAAGRPLRFDGIVTDHALEAAWAACSFSVYPSEIEGFGLPIIESLARGKPCVCAASGATGELVPGGGCLGVQPADAPAFAAALRSLLTDEPLRLRLSDEARRRPVPTWEGCARHLLDWMYQLPRRAA
ncbi:MAG: glycosyltransferase [Opitutaceae bacterium]|nr:glycosyltransferase [Opitutaceae bacterium]